MVTVPLLLLLNFDIKAAVGVSSVAMVFSSVYGTFRNYRLGKIKIDRYSFIGVGALFGGVLGAYLLSISNDKYVGYILLSLLLFAFIRLLLPKKEQNNASGSISKALAFVIGVGIGSVASFVGVGGAVLLLPILVGFFHVSIKEAVGAGLLFVVFSSVSGCGTLIYLDLIPMKEALIVATLSLFGVKFGQFVNSKIDEVLHRKLIVVMYVVLIGLLSYKIF
jgi:uncharacterized protein